MIDRLLDWADDHLLPILASAIVGFVLLIAGVIVWQSSQPPSPRLYEGKVTAKNFTPAYSYSYMLAIPHTQCSGSGTSQSCYTFTTYIPMTQHVPDRWTLRVVGCKRLKDEQPITFCQKQAHKDVSVPEDQYNHTSVGQEWHEREA